MPSAADTRGVPLQTAEDYVYLLSCAVNGATPDVSRVAAMDLDAILQLGQRHSAAVPVCYALERSGAVPDAYREHKGKVLRRLALYETERPKILRGLEQQGIWHLPLKGAVLQSCYPEFGMREMSDNDILCDGARMEDVRAVMEGLGYACKPREGDPHDVYTKGTSLVFEMHRCLFDDEEMPRFSHYYKDVARRLLQDGSGFCRRFSDEDFYVYLTAHAYKHFALSGTGIRTLLDVYVFLRRFGGALDWDYLRGELQTLALTDFEQRNRTLSQKLITGGTLTEEETETFLYIIGAGAFGTRELYLRNRLKRFAGEGNAKRSYFKNRFFISGSALKKNYPFFYRHQRLLPVLYLARPVKGLLTHPKRVWREVKKVRELDAE